MAFGLSEGITFGLSEGMALGRSEGMVLSQSERMTLGQSERMALSWSERMALSQSEGMVLSWSNRGTHGDSVISATILLSCKTGSAVHFCSVLSTLGLFVPLPCKGGWFEMTFPLAGAGFLLLVRAGEGVILTVFFGLLSFLCHWKVECLEGHHD